MEGTATTVALLAEIPALETEADNVLVDGGALISSVDTTVSARDCEEISLRAYNDTRPRIAIVPPPSGSFARIDARTAELTIGGGAGLSARVESASVAAVCGDERGLRETVGGVQTLVLRPQPSTLLTIVQPSIEELVVSRLTAIDFRALIAVPLPQQTSIEQISVAVAGRSFAGARGADLYLDGLEADQATFRISRPDSLVSFRFSGSAATADLDGASLMPSRLRVFVVRYPYLVGGWVLVLLLILPFSNRIASNVVDLMERATGRPSAL